MDTQDILFQYLKDVIYYTDKAHLDLEELPPEFRKLGQGMQLLGQWVGEAKKFSTALARGDLSYIQVDRENIFAAPMKEQQSMLRHLAWQTQQVAKGDYSQTVDFMGEFSEAFNTMTRQLKERREALIAEKRQIEEKNEELERAFELAMVFSNYTHNMIFIHSQDGSQELYENEFARCFLESRPDDGKILREKLVLKDKEAPKETVRWDMEISSASKREDYNYFNVESYPIMWRQQDAFVHIVVDDTERKRREHLMYELAYADALTGLHNRRYALEEMTRLVEEGIPFVLSFIDVDYLKYCNDTQGHQAGDAYLLEISRALGAVGGVLCRTGGDEFMLIRTEKTAEEQDYRLANVREMVMRAGRDSVYPQSFSFASCEIPANPEKSLEEYIMQADAMMYEFKEKYKVPLKDTAYRDNRKLKNRNLDIESPDCRKSGDFCNLREKRSGKYGF